MMQQGEADEGLLSAGRMCNGLPGQQHAGECRERATRERYSKVESSMMPQKRRDWQCMQFLGWIQSSLSPKQ